MGVYHSGCWACTAICSQLTSHHVLVCPRDLPWLSDNNNNNKRPLTPKSMPPAGDEHTKLKT